MIIDKLEYIRKYQKCFSKLIDVFDFIQSVDLKSLAEGKHQMPDDLGFIGLDRVMARPKDGASLEAHKNYIDIQLPFNAIEIMGWKSVSDCCRVKTPYKEETDIVFYSDDVDFYIPVRPGQFIIFFPEDAHAPIIGSGIIHKAVIKVKI
ncbi:MAG TPA: YhcH/YjgK/YiaL family protein [Lentisphaeria bacterium]|nr:MAG: hypothetical protein A2X47_01860 [Lentisphaerae bacterium GWF2_38_69]HBM15678.1 YhcH/YjgK/YiaL family protein [Lentisphaeria bacterium]